MRNWMMEKIWMGLLIQPKVVIKVSKELRQELYQKLAEGKVISWEIEEELLNDE